MSRKKTKVLVVDDEQVVCDLLHDDLSERGYLCNTSLDGKDALIKLAADDFDVVLLDIRLPGMSGMDVLREIWLNHRNTITIMITAINDVATSVKAMKLGASDYIVKPFDLNRVDAGIRTALETRQAPTQMDAIAHGVESKLDPFSAYSKIVTQRTVAISRQLGIANEEIKRWVALKAAIDSEKNGVTKSPLGKAS